MNNEEMNGSLAVNEKVYRIVLLLGKGKGGYSYLAEQDGHPVVVKQIHHEPCDYYTFGNKIEAELRDYERLQKAGIRVPGMHAVDMDAERIVKDYIEGPTVMEQRIDRAVSAPGAGYGGKGHGGRAEHRLLPDQLCCA